jgi:hypothetical protein
MTRTQEAALLRVRRPALKGLSALPSKSGDEIGGLVFPLACLVFGFNPPELIPFGSFPVPGIALSRHSVHT